VSTVTKIDDDTTAALLDRRAVGQRERCGTASPEQEIATSTLPHERPGTRLSTVYITRVTLQDIKGFQHLDLSFARPSGDYAGWSVITG